MNRRGWALLLILLPVMAVRADALSDAYQDGSSTGKGSTSGANAIKNTSPSDIIPGFSSSPSQTGYYGGVQGGGGSMSSDGQAALNSSEAGQAAENAMINNPKTTIDPNADFITNGKNAESTSDSVTNGTYAQCTDKVVSKTTFQNYTCDRDISYTGSCTRSASPGGHYETRSTLQTISVDPKAWVYNQEDDGIHYQFPLPAGATLVSGTIRLHGLAHTSTFNHSMTLWGTKLVTTNQNGEYYENFSINVGGVVIPDTGLVTGLITLNRGAGGSTLIGYYQTGYLSWELTVQIMSTEQVWVPEVTWSSPSCNVDPETSQLTNSTCSVPGGNQTTYVNGQTQTVYSDCWQYTDTYQVNAASNGTCSALMSDPNCTSVSSSCTETTNSACSHVSQTYQCQKTITSTGKMCGGDYFCITGDCAALDPSGDNGIDLAISKLAGLASAGDSVRSDQVNVRAFTGQAQSCRKAMAGFSNCCVDSGWGNSASLAHCNSEEIALGQAKAKKLVISVGESCAQAVLGVCIQKKQVYCEFGNKLARIIQQQGRQGQLGIGFGSGDSPDCRGITVPELSSINFDKIDFSDFFEDFEKNKNIPNQGVLTDRINQQIQAQIPQNSGANK